MKKDYIFFIIASFAVLLSCSREIPQTNTVEETPGEVRPDGPGESRIDTGFSATLPVAASTKTAVNISSGSITWLTDDPIMVTNGNSQMMMYVSEGGSTTADLYAMEEVIEGPSFYAAYPAEGASYVAGTFQVTIPTVQSFVRGGFASQTFPMVAHCDAKRNFGFKNAASLLRIVVSSDFFKNERISSVSVSANEPLSGMVYVSYPSGDDDPVVDSSAGEKTVYISAPEDGIPFGEPIYVTVAPGDYSSLSIRISLTSGLNYVHTVQEPLHLKRSAYQTIEVDLEDNYQDLSATERANCYMLTRSGSYKFRADIKGNGVVTSCSLPALTSGIAGVKVYHTDGEPFLDGDFALVGNYIYFSTVSGTLPTGTALVSVLDANGNTLWSWHIWANRLIDDVTLSDGSVWLNMNLGAHQVGFNKKGYNGYYYQWGRKDPFLQKYTSDTKVETLAPFVSHASATDGSLENSIANPHIFYGGYHPSGTDSITEDWSTYEDDVKVYDWWNKNITGDDQVSAPASKTMFDPCPPGYHVPVYSDLQSLRSLAASNPIYSSEGRRVEEGKLYFPYTSYRYFALYTDWWPGGSQKEASRIFIPSSTPSVTGGKSQRRYYRMYMTSSPSQGITSAQRSYGVPVRCIKEHGTVLPDTGSFEGDIENFDTDDWE